MSQDSETLSAFSTALPPVSPGEQLQDAVDVAQIESLLAVGDLAQAQALLQLLRTQMEKSKTDKKEKKKDKKGSADDSKHDRKKGHLVQKHETKEREKAAREAIKESEKSELCTMRETERREREAIKDIERKQKELDRKAEKERKERDKRASEDQREKLREERRLAEELREKMKEERREKLKEDKEKQKEEKPKPPPKNAGMKSLMSFGFGSSEKKKQHDEDRSRLFSSFVQDRRIVPQRLQFWSGKQSDEAIERPLSYGGDEPTIRSACSLCSCSMHSSASAPEGFCNEVVFCGFFAVGYEPCQARPSYFGTMNSVLTGDELNALARFPAGQLMPRLSTLDYEYDSGDDWDQMDSDEDVEQSDEEDEDEDSQDSDDSFIDDAECGDSDGELVSNVMNARLRRQNRLKGKEKLIPGYSGPFANMPFADHPMRTQDAFEMLLPCTPTAVTSMLLDEVLKHDVLDCVNPVKSVHRFRMVGEAEMQELHTVAQSNPTCGREQIIELLAKRQTFSGISVSEIRRTLKRFYDRHGKVLTRREIPWDADDSRLFEKTGTRSKKVTQVQVEKRARDEETEALSVMGSCEFPIGSDALVNPTSAEVA